MMTGEGNATLWVGRAEGRHVPSQPRAKEEGSGLSSASAGGETSSLEGLGCFQAWPSQSICPFFCSFLVDTQTEVVAPASGASLQKSLSMFLLPQRSGTGLSSNDGGGPLRPGLLWGAG
jgi:hypothetical protein